MSIKLMVMSFGLVLAQFEPDEGINYTVWCLLMMTIFVLAFKATRDKMRGSDWWSGLDDPEEEYVEVEINSYGNRPMTEEDWNVICRTAIEEAKNGSASARTWVTKNIAEGGVPTPTATPTPSSKPSSGTPSSSTAPDIVKDAISGLRSAGHTKAEATSRVQQCLAEKVYDNVEDLLRDAFSK